MILEGTFLRYRRQCAHYAEAAADAQPLFGTSTSTRGPLSQPRARHEDLARRFCSRIAPPCEPVIAVGLLLSSAPGEALFNRGAVDVRTRKRSAYAAACAAASDHKAPYADDLRTAQHLSAHAVRASHVYRGAAHPSAPAGRPGIRRARARRASARLGRRGRP